MREIGEVVAVYIENKPSVYARIEDYEPDIKPRWYKVKMLFLTFPPQEITWILREVQIDGESFTMNNIPISIKQIPAPSGRIPERAEPRTQRAKGGNTKIISLAERSKNKK